MEASLKAAHEVYAESSSKTNAAFKKVYDSLRWRSATISICGGRSRNMLTTTT